MIRSVITALVFILAASTAELRCENIDMEEENPLSEMQEQRRSLEGSSSSFTDVAWAVNTLGFRILNQIREYNPNGNIIFSPLGISAAFSLAYFGANGRTKREIEEVMGFQARTVPDSLKKTFEEFGGNSNQIARIANKVYVDDDVHLEDAYKMEIGHDNFEIVDFSNAEPSRQRINAWVDDVTAGLIKDLLPSGSIDDLTRLMLVNAIYFKGMWKSKFPSENTHSAQFRGPSGTAKTKFMVQKNQRFRTKILLEADSRVLELPYIGDRFSMFLVLPNSDNGFTTLEKDIENLGSQLFTGLYPDKFATVQIPKWSVEQSMGNLKTILQTLGIQSAFSDWADFSGMTSEGVLISDVIHKAKISVDEEGTEAAAATAIIISSKSASFSDELDFIADHPFVYFIVDNHSQTIFFQGTFASP